MAYLRIIDVRSIPDINVALDAANKALSDREGEFFLFPGFCDVHVHFREPGFSYKETIKTGSLAAKRGGVVMLMVEPKGGPVGAWNHVLHALQEPFNRACGRDQRQ